MTIDEVEQAFRATGIDEWVTGPAVEGTGALVELTVRKDGVGRQVDFAPELAG